MPIVFRLVLLLFSLFFLFKIPLLLVSVLFSFLSMWGGNRKGSAGRFEGLRVIFLLWWLHMCQLTVCHAVFGPWLDTAFRVNRPRTYFRPPPYCTKFNGNYSSNYSTISLKTPLFLNAIIFIHTYNCVFASLLKKKNFSSCTIFLENLYIFYL